jgi:hypothetical protein
MKKRTIFSLIVVSLLLAACAPQVTVTPEATLTLPPPTDLPTLTPTPIAVDGIAEDAEGNKLAYLDGEWTVLPDLEGDYRLMADADGVRALDENGAVKYTLDMATGEWVEAFSEAVLQAQEDFKKYGFPIEGLEWLEDENGVRAIDPETNKVVYHDGKFDVFFVREALVEAGILMPTKYKQMTPGERVWPGTPTDGTRVKYLGDVLVNSFSSEFMDRYGYDPYKDVSGNKLGGIAFLLDDLNNSWGVVLNARLEGGSDAVSKVLLFETKESGVVWVELMSVDSESIRSFWNN